jgi:hypothetical protein
MKKVSLLSMALAFAVVVTSCKKEEEDDNNNNQPPAAVGIQGKWQSSGADVAPLLVNLFGIDSLYAEFNTNNTYLVRQWASGTELVSLTGVYTQANSGVNGIWTIEVNQSAPSALISEGIFKVEGNMMMYEVVQTNPDIQAVPPTPQGGFGSTNGGALGNLNVQTYRKVN